MIVPVLLANRPSGSSYRPQAVRFDGATDLLNPATSVPDGSGFLLALYQRIPDPGTDTYQSVWVVAPEGAYSPAYAIGTPGPNISFVSVGPDESPQNASNPLLLADQWQSIIIAGKATGAPSQVKTYFGAAVSGDGQRIYIAPGNGPSGKCYFTDGTLPLTELAGSPAGDWRGLACSSDGTVVLGNPSGAVYLSTDGGSSWSVPTDLSAIPSTSYNLAVSGDGTRMVIVDQDNGTVWNSVDGGSTWTSIGATDAGSPIACHDDNMKFAGIGSNHVLHVSTDAGATWPTTFDFNTLAAGNYGGLAASADFSKMVAMNYSAGLIYVSADGGASWAEPAQQPGIQINNPFGAQPLAMSGNGSRIVVVGINETKISNDFGATWSSITNAPALGLPRPFKASLDLGVMLVGGPAGAALSQDIGVTWVNSLLVDPPNNALVAIIDGVDSGMLTIDLLPETGVVFNGLSMQFGNDGFGDPLTADLCNVQLFVGDFFTGPGGTLPQATIELFIKDGRIVDPAVAAAVLGPPAVAFIGDAAAWTAQAAAQGFAITGTLTDAPTAP